MNDESPDIHSSPESGDASPQPDSGPEPVAAKKKRSKISAKAATAALEARIAYKFADPTLLTTAFTHVSALKPTRKKGDKRGDSYQRLEFLGDHVLGLVVSDMLYRAFPKADEGELSKRLADLVRKESCADVAKLLGLADDIKLGQVGAGAGARLRKSVLGDICEAVIGAVFLDGGYGAAAQFVERNWTERMRKPRRPLRDPKTVLQEWAQGQAAADAGVSRDRAHRAASRSAVPRRRGFAGTGAGRRRRRQQARRRKGRGVRDDRARRRRWRQQ